MNHDILALQQELEDAQRMTGTCKISERNAMQLILKLRDLGKIDVVHTLTGNEFLTLPKLKSEIFKTIEDRRGRTRIDCIAACLNIESGTIDAIVHELESSEMRLLFGSEVVTATHMKSLIQEIDEKLQVVGHMTLVDIASEHSLPVPFLTEYISTGTFILKNGCLYSPSFQKRINAKVRGALAGVTRPVSLAAVSKLINVVELDRTVEDLIRAKILVGTLRTGEYVPALFTAMQKQEIDDSLRHKGYCSLKNFAVINLNSKKALSYVQDTCGTAVLLPTRIITQGFMDSLISLLILSESSVIDVRNIAPAEFSISDSATILDYCIANAPFDCIVCCDKTVALKRVYFQLIESACLEFSKEQAELQFSEEGEENLLENLSEFIQINFLELEEAVANQKLVAEVAELLMEQSRRIFSKTISELSLVSKYGEVGLRRKKQSELGDLFSTLFMEVMFLYNQVLKLSEESSFILSLIKRLVIYSTGCLIEHQCYIFDINTVDDTGIPEYTGIAGKHSKQIWYSVKDLQLVISRFPDKTLRNSISDLLNSNNPESISELSEQIETLQGLGRECLFVIRKEDKKYTKQMIQNHRQAILAVCNTISDGPSLHFYATALLFQICHNCVIPAFLANPLSEASLKFSKNLIPRLDLKLGGSWTSLSNCLLSDFPDESCFSNVRQLLSLKDPTKG